MLKKTYPLAFGAMMLSCLNYAFADEVCNYTPGVVTCGAGTVSNVIGNGVIQLNGTTVTGKVVANGSLTANNATLNSVIVNGSLTTKNSTLNTVTVNGLSSFTNTKVSTTATLLGSINSTGSSFLQSLTIQTNKATFDSTSINNITVQAVKPPVQQSLTLKNATKVLGSVSFEQENGLVYLSSDSNIKGKVNNGSVIHK